MLLVHNAYMLVPIRFDDFEAAVGRAEDNARLFGTEANLGGAGVYANRLLRKSLQSIRCGAGAFDPSMLLPLLRLLVEPFAYLYGLGRAGRQHILLQTKCQN